MFKGWYIHTYFETSIVYSNVSWGIIGTLKEIKEYINYGGKFDEQIRISRNKINVSL